MIRIILMILSFSDEVIPNYGTEGGASGEVICPRGGARGRRTGNLTSLPRAALLRSSSSLSSSPFIEPSVSGGFNSTIIVQGTTIDTTNHYHHHHHHHT
ncbi:unnamed protein product [Cercopithifilaria johnstoni]|uniref:Uncharacterized protein n=1 Tax=Cercopithifilaria johnstoni TaxID=2874296 RepID=A0A8J2LXJ8_9BILA|nr:unnamed protein product [Cercopithifilaria johnstoni]